MADAIAKAPGKKPLNIFYTTLHDRNLGSFRLLVDSVLPVRYSDEVYKVLVSSPADFTKLAYYDDIFVGTIGCRVEPHGTQKKLYIMVLAVLAPYRDRGIGSAMLETVLKAVESHPDIKEVYLHVHTANDDAQKFYKKFGFDVGEKLEKYYRGIDPPDAFVMRKAVNTSAST